MLDLVVLNDVEAVFLMVITSPFCTVNDVTQAPAPFFLIKPSPWETTQPICTGWPLMPAGIVKGKVNDDVLATSGSSKSLYVPVVNSVPRPAIVISE